MYVFDTDSISQLLRSRPPEAFIRRLARLPMEEAHITSITLGELYFGVYHAQHPKVALARLQERLLPKVKVLDFDGRAAERYGQVREGLSKAGRMIGHADCLIAAVVLVHGYVLVTGNVKEFRRVPSLRVEDWLRG